MKSFENYAIGDISLEGFQVVKGNYFNRQNEPHMSFRETSISFNVSSYRALNCVTSVQIMVNKENKKVLVRPVSEGEKDSVAWIKNIEALNSKPIECASFTRPLYAMWKWKPKTRYRAHGKLVKHDKKVMLLFDFSSAVIVPPGLQNPPSRG